MPARKAVDKPGIEQHRNCMAAAEEADAPEDAALQNLFDLDVRRITAHLMGHHKFDASLFDRGGHPITVGKSEGHRLLTENIFARRGRRQHHLGMAIGLTGDDHCVDGGVSQQFRNI